MGAELLLGLKTFLAFAVEVGAISEAEARPLERRGGLALLDVVRAQGEHIGAADPVQHFLESVASAFLAGEAHLTEKTTQGVPSEEFVHSLGWRRADHEPGVLWRPMGPRIGWVDSSARQIYLVPHTAYRLAQRQSENSSANINTGERTLWKRLAEANVLCSWDPERNTKTTRIGTQTHKLLHLRIGVLFGESGTSGTPAADVDGAVGKSISPPIRARVRGEAPTESGTGIGIPPHSARAREDGGSAPVPASPQLTLRLTEVLARDPSPTSTSLHAHNPIDAGTSRPGHLFGDENAGAHDA